MNGRIKQLLKKLHKDLFVTNFTWYCDKSRHKDTTLIIETSPTGGVFCSCATGKSIYAAATNCGAPAGAKCAFRCDESQHIKPPVMTMTVVTAFASGYQFQRSPLAAFFFCARRIPYHTPRDPCRRCAFSSAGLQAGKNRRVSQLTLRSLTRLAQVTISTIPKSEPPD